MQQSGTILAGYARGGGLGERRYKLGRITWPLIIVKQCNERKVRPSVKN